MNKKSNSAGFYFCSHRKIGILFIFLLIILYSPSFAKESNFSSNQVPSSQTIEGKSPEPAGLEFMGRGLMMLRANYFGKSPAERAAAITETLERVILKHYDKEITTKELPEGTLLSLGDETLMLVAKVDLAPEYGQEMKNVVDHVIKGLADAKKEVALSRSFKYLFRLVLYCFGATLVFIAFLFILKRVYKFLMEKFEALELRISNMINIQGFGVFQQIVPIPEGFFE